MGYNLNQFGGYVRSRPFGVTLMGLLHLLTGAANICGGILGVPGAVLAFVCNPLGIFDPVKAIIAGVLFLLVGSALMGGAGWARWLAIVASAVNLVNLLRGGVTAGGEFWGIILSVIVLIYMFTPGVVAYFNRRR